MCKLLSMALSLTLVLLPALAAATDDNWKLEKDKDGIQVYTRAVEGWSIREIRGTTQLPVKLSAVVAVFDDVPALSELNEYVSKAEVRNRESDLRYQIYTQTKMPWPVSDRDILNQRNIAQDSKTLAVTITDAATDKILPPTKGMVRIVKSTQVWTLTPDAKGVNVEMRLLSDPNGPIPASLINSMSVSNPYKTLVKLKELSQRPKYLAAKPAFIKDPQAN